MPRGVKSSCCILQRRDVTLFLTLKMQWGIKEKIPGNISQLHDAARSQIIPPHDAAGSQFGSEESSLKTLEDSLGP
jgi:hypothetical protein